MKTTGINTAVLIGSGNVASHLGMALLNAGITIFQVYSPTATNAKALAKKLHAKAVSNLADIDTTADIIIIAIKDDALAEIGKTLRVGKTLVVHTSGATPTNVLEKCSANYGVFYPFQTFNKSVKVDFTNVPVCIEANAIKAEKQLEGLAKLVTNTCYKLDSNQRQWLVYGPTRHGEFASKYRLGSGCYVPTERGFSGR
jgi:hypothetical protein